MGDFPSKEQIRDFIEHAQNNGGEVSRREIARAFNIKGEDRTYLRQLLKQMANEGVIDQNGKRTKVRGQLPPVAVLDILDIDKEGDLICSPPNWQESFAPPAITLPSRLAAKTRPMLGKGDRFLGRLSRLPDGTYESSPIKHIGQGADRVLGVFKKKKFGGMVEPVSRKAKRELIIEEADCLTAEEGDLVWAETKNSRGYGPRHARIREVLGKIDGPESFSLIALANFDIRVEFPQKVHLEAESAELPDLGKREDLRQTPLITIDPADARDHDDAVFAAPFSDETVDNGWRVIVAIADVSYFVPIGSALDKEAQKRANSTYLPDQVVPMLPERLSNDLCSLRENEDRPALAVEMIFNERGQKIRHRFMRIMMRSAARLSYGEVQAAFDGEVTDRTAPLNDVVLKPLWNAYKALTKAREKRAPLNLDLPERKILFDEKGHVKAVSTKERFEANKLIEEFMIQANVCAAETLEEAKLPTIYRVHGEPDEDKISEVRNFLETLGYSLPKGIVVKPKNFNQILHLAEKRDESDMISQVLLRSQRQAIYDTKNVGHFGLNLTRYAHFTSPIRRYADLTVHRGLVQALRLEPDGPSLPDLDSLQKTAETISDLERNSMAAERESTDRFLAAWLSERVGAEFSGKINGVTKSGLFVCLDENGADGFIPARTIGREYFIFDEGARALIGERSKLGYRIGQKVDVRLREVTPLQGGLLFEMLSEPEEGIQRSANTPSRTRSPAGRSRSGKGNKAKAAKHRRKRKQSR